MCITDVMMLSMAQVVCQCIFLLLLLKAKQAETVSFTGGHGNLQAAVLLSSQGIMESERLKLIRGLTFD